MQRVRQSEAARQLGVNRSTVSRWIKRTPSLEDEHGLVSIEELEEHRKGVLNPAMQTKATPATKRQHAGPSLNDHRARREEARAEREEIELAEKRQLTLLRADVEAKLAVAGGLLRQGAAQLARDKAEELARIDDVREMEQAIDAMMRGFLDGASKALAEAAGQQADVQ